MGETRRTQQSDAVWWTALTIALLFFTWLNPLGYIGGGWDDWRYLSAVRCWREFGPCLPRDHWQGRWPVIAPAAAVTAIFGEDRITVGLTPFFYSVASLMLISVVGNRLFGKPTGWLAAILTIFAPAFSIQVFDLAVEAPELMFCLLGFLALLKWIQNGDAIFAAFAGLGFSLAVQVRETALIATAFAGFYGLRCRRPAGRDILTGLLGFGLPFLVEFLIFYAAVGDPMWRHRLSLQHARIPSSELSSSVDTRQSPLLNKAYIAGWRREPGVHIYWAIDGFLNLFVNSKAGMSLVLVPLLAATLKKVDKSTRRSALQLWLVALLYAAVLIYVLAIDPKARMMFVPIVLANMGLAILTWRGRATYKAVTATVWLAYAGAGALIVYGHQSTVVVEAPAADWIRQHKGQIETDDNTARTLTLVPEGRNLSALGSGRPYLLYGSNVACSLWLKLNGLPEGSLTPVSEAKISKLGWLEPKLSGALCLYKYNKTLSADEVRGAITRSRPDGPFITTMN